jgi:hypothetical protein
MSKMQEGLISELGLALFIHLTMHFKIFEIHLKFGSMTNYLWEQLNKASTLWNCNKYKFR